MEVTAVVPFWNGHAYVDKLIRSLTIPVLVIDDVSDSPLVDTPSRGVEVVRLERKRYFSGAVNEGFLRTRGDVLILNQDVEVQEEALLAFLAQHRDRYGIIGERIDGYHPAWPDGYVHGTCMFVRRDVIERIGWSTPTRVGNTNNTSLTSMGPLGPPPRVWGIRCFPQISPSRYHQPLRARISLHNPHCRSTTRPRPTTH